MYTSGKNLIAGRHERRAPILAFRYGRVGRWAVFHPSRLGCTALDTDKTDKGCSRIEGCWGDS